MTASIWPGLASKLMPFKITLRLSGAETRTLTTSSTPLGRGPIGKDEQGLDDARLVFERGLDQQVDVVREALEAVLDDGKAAHHDITRAEPVQFSADPAQVRKLRRSRNFFFAAAIM